jgi:phosphoenolpyruvate-protein phosphotransferase (PTS system enzyme I)
LAADRGNERLRHLQSADRPAVLKLIRMICVAAREHGIWVGVCGEAAADAAMIPKLIELGVTELSMSAPSIPRAKKVVSEL